MSKAEKFIEEHTSNGSNYSSYAQTPIPWLTPDQALKAVEIAKEELREKAILWVKTHTFMFESLEEVELYKELFKQAMKDE